MADVALAEHPPLIVDGALRARGPETAGVAHGPAREKAAVAPAHHAEPLGIDDIVSPDRFIERRHHVGEVSTAPVTDHRACERFAVALAAARIRVDHHVASGGVDLELVEEPPAILGVRPAMDVEESGALRPR